MKILVSADPMLPVPPLLYGGIERIIDSLVVHLRRRGHEVALLAHRDSACDATARFEWPNKAGALVHMRRLAGVVSEFRPDVVHSFSRLAYLAGILPWRRIPKVMSFQREPTPRTVRWAHRLSRGSLQFTGCSEYIRQRGERAGGKWRSIHNFVDLARYTFVPHVPDDAPLVFLSRIEPIKGAHIAIEACRRAGRKLIIAGNHSEAEDEEGRYWREVIQPRIDGRHVEYIGPVNDAQKNELLGRAAALIVPIQWEEPFGIVFVEALACGTPVISCPRGALPEIVDNKVHGFLVPAADAVAASISLLSNLSRKECRARAERSFSVEAILPLYERCYMELAPIGGDNHG